MLLQEFTESWRISPEANINEYVFPFLKRRKADEEITGLEDASQWSRVIEAFSVLFSSDGPGLERDSFLAEKAGAAGRVSRLVPSVAFCGIHSGILIHTESWMMHCNIYCTI